MHTLPYFPHIFTLHTRTQWSNVQMIWLVLFSQHSWHSFLLKYPHHVHHSPQWYLSSRRWYRVGTRPINTRTFVATVHIYCITFIHIIILHHPLHALICSRHLSYHNHTLGSYVLTVPHSQTPRTYQLDYRCSCACLLLRPTICLSVTTQQLDTYIFWGCVI